MIEAWVASAGVVISLLAVGANVWITTVNLQRSSQMRMGEAKLAWAEKVRDHAADYITNLSILGSYTEQIRAGKGHPGKEFAEVQKAVSRAFNNLLIFNVTEDRKALNDWHLAAYERMNSDMFVEGTDFDEFYQIVSDLIDSKTQEARKLIYGRAK